MAAPANGHLTSI